MRLIFAVLFAAAAASPTPGGPKPKIEVMVDPSALAMGKDVGAAWLGYAMARATLIVDRQKLKVPQHNRSADDYSIELGARSVMADFWMEAGRPKSPYLDELVEIKKAGFLEDYVLVYFRKTGLDRSTRVTGEDPHQSLS